MSYTKDDMFAAAMFGYKLGKDVEEIQHIDEQTLDTEFERWMRINYEDGPTPNYGVPRFVADRVRANI